MITKALMYGAVISVFSIACSPPEEGQDEVAASALGVAKPEGVHAGSLHTAPSPFLTAANPGGSHNVTYHGGRVLANVKVFVVFWGNNVNPTLVAKMPGVYSAATGPVYMDWLQEYSTNSIPIGRGSLGGTFTITPFNNNSLLQQSDIQTELANQINSGKLPAPDANTLYMVHFPPGKVLSSGGQQSCGHSPKWFCAYHGHFNFNGQSLVYGALPDSGSGSGCEQCTPFNQVIDFSPASHELIEAVTDPDGNAWFDGDQGHEVGDICVGLEDLLPSIIAYAQLQWSQRHGACTLGYPSGTIRGVGGKVFTVPPSSANQSPVYYNQWIGSDTQQWTLTPNAQIMGATGRCMDLPGANTADHTLIQYFDCNGGVNQTWLFNGANIRGYGNKCIDLPSGNTANGTLLQYYPCSNSGSSNQHWTFTAAGEIRGLGNKCLDLPNASTADGTRVQYYNCNGGANQKWTAGPSGQITGLGGKCLELQASSTADHTPIQISTCTGDANQRWLIQGPITGLGGKCIDLPSANTTDGTRLQYYGCNGGSNQEWWFYP